MCPSFARVCAVHVLCMCCACAVHVLTLTPTLTPTLTLTLTLTPTLTPTLTLTQVGGMVAKATTIGADLVADYTICHHNWEYDFLVPSDKECTEAYIKLYGKDARISDGEGSSGSSSSGGEGSDADEGSAE